MNLSKNEWVAPLLARYRAILEHDKDVSTSLTDNFNGLRLADAVMDKLELNQRLPEHSPQVTIIGPTQAGKSTLVNVLLDAELAGISPLAAFTVHAQGFAADAPTTEYAAIETVLNPLTREPQQSLTSESLNKYSLDAVKTGRKRMIAHGIVWDSPDFDSIDARGYQSAVLATIALSDILVLMLSKDKYGDKSVWNMLELIKDLGRPVIVVINKLDERDKATVINAFSERYEATFNESCPTIVDFPFVDGGWRALPKANLALLNTAIKKATKAIDRDLQISACQAFIDANRTAWLTPLKHELDARQTWLIHIDDALDAAEQTYVTAYLENPDKYETFNRALGELLSLLEIPGIAATLARTRSIVTWPARTLFGFGKTAVTSRLDSKGNSGLDQEAEILGVMYKEVVTNLHAYLLEQQQEPGAQQHWWLKLSKRFSSDSKQLNQNYQQTAALAREEFEPRIEETAQRLYEQLQDQPRLLNALRAARVSADAAGVALAVKSGGLAPSDLILAPAMLSVTSLLTESALGRYLEMSKKALKQEQQQHIRKRVLDGVLKTELQAMTEFRDNSTLLVSDLPDAILQALESMDD